MPRRQGVRGIATSYQVQMLRSTHMMESTNQSLIRTKSTSCGKVRPIDHKTVGPAPGGRMAGAMSKLNISKIITPRHTSCGPRPKALRNRYHCGLNSRQQSRLVILLTVTSVLRLRRLPYPRSYAPVSETWR